MGKQPWLIYRKSTLFSTAVIFWQAASTDESKEISASRNTRLSLGLSVSSLERWTAKREAERPRT